MCERLSHWTGCVQRPVWSAFFSWCCCRSCQSSTCQLLTQLEERGWASFEFAHQLEITAGSWRWILESRMLWVKHKETSKVRVTQIWGFHTEQLNHRLLRQFLYYISLVQLDKNTVPTLWGIRVWPVYEQWERAAENWGRQKKPVLISCGLVFPAGISTERGAAAVAWGDQSHQKNVTPTTSLFPHFPHFAYFCTPISFFLTLGFPFIPLSLPVFYLSSTCSELHQNFSAH